MVKFAQNGIVTAILALGGGMSKDDFKRLVKPIADRSANHPLDASLAALLNREFSGDSPLFRAIETACHRAIEEGWMCARQHGGIRYGRVIEPDDDLAGCSVDVVHMQDIAGPYHRHPNGEIDMVMPLTGDARFDSAPRGWKVYEPGSAHRPTVTGGAALILYLLPGGAIDFTRP